MIGATGVTGEKIWEDDASLSAQADLFHMVFFRRNAPPQLIERYLRANRACFPLIDPVDGRIADTIVRFKLDAEAVELALRLRGAGLLLTKKLQIFFYLIEVMPEYYGAFINQKPGFWKAIRDILGAVLKTAYKLVKGRALIVRHELL
jgi:hypothetical protein